MLTLIFVCSQDVFEIETKEEDLFIGTQGLLTLEHCGIPAREHDGMCITAAYIVPDTLHDRLSEVKNSEYTWAVIRDKRIQENLTNRILNGKRLIPCVSS